MLDIDEEERNSTGNISNNFIFEENDYESDSYAPDDNINEDECEYNDDENNYNQSILQDDDFIEEPLPVYKSFEEAKEIEFINYLAFEVEEKFQKMSPIELFFFTFEKLFENIAIFSNNYAQKRHKCYNSNIAKNGIIIYIYIYIFLSVYKYPEIESLWENNPLINNTIPNIITRGRYRQINKYIYISDNPFIYTKNIYDNNKSQKINFLIDYFNNKWKSMYPFTKFITIDESMCSYKGEIYFKQYMKDKHKKFGIKFFVKESADSGYIYPLPSLFR